MTRPFFIILYFGTCIFRCLCSDGVQNVRQVQEYPLSGNEDCCEELIEENIRRKMEIALLTDTLEKEIRDRKDAIENEINNRKQADEIEISNRTQADQIMKQDILNTVPLGTILPWVNKPTKDASHQEDLPEGFMLCDGSAITKGPWEGLTLPDLTSTGKFLRGGEFKEVLDMEDSIIEDHTHIDPGHSHSDNGHSHTDSGHSHTFTYTKDVYAYTAGPYFRGGNDLGEAQSATQYTSTGHSSIQEGKASITTSDTGMGGVATNGNNVGDANRPTNMRVLFIMKVDNESS